ncbi:AI-2E family transporter [Frigidibacter sp.]|uniref:AI-2E family transporter n=1 Tax=Frigidibacter sp. TaxID=2586418 RepID=UPI002735CD05|nr:AI-2E family transporter [Frigidibacter sp.]MDP3339721.1 AI-2E family transporter [Frigidibacter sp.]
MALPVRQQMKYWGIAAAVFLVVLWGLGNVILPFLVGGAVAYFMDPVADRLERTGMSRTAATAVISIVAVVGFILAALLVIPTLVRQLAQLINTAPTILGQLQTFLEARFPTIMDNESVLRETLGSIGEMIRSRGGELVTTVLSSAMGVVNFVVFIVVVPVVAFYMLLDWDKMIARIDAWLPRDHAPTIRRIASDIDRVLAGFVRGQVLVCVILGVYYSVALALAGLNFGLVVGAIAGFLTFIPYVGALVGGGLAIGLALFQFWGEWWMIALIWAIFQSGQFVEGNILTPKLVGSSVGLHPVWLLFALSAFGTLFGFAGMLVAVPVAAALGVIARFLISQYTESKLYNGLDSAPEPDFRVEVSLAPTAQPRLEPETGAVILPPAGTTGQTAP